jgi:hypothetical protein
VGSGRSYTWTIAGLVIGSPVGMLAGMAQANATSNDFIPLLTGTIIGGLLFAAVLGGIGYVIDRARHSARAR